MVLKIIIVSHAQTDNTKTQIICVKNAVTNVVNALNLQFAQNALFQFLILEMELQIVTVINTITMIYRMIPIVKNANQLVKHVMEIFIIIV